MVMRVIDAIRSWARCALGGHDWFRYGWWSTTRTCARCLRVEERIFLGDEPTWRQVP
jgi:hypothetical protein